MNADDPSGPSRYAAFRHPAYARFFAARFLATFSTQIVSVAVGWQIYDLTRDPFDLGLVGLIQFAPALLLVLVTGAAADKFGRRLIMGLSAALEAICAAAILILTIRGLTSPLPVFAILAVFGVARAFFAPASGALVANLVPAKDFANAVGLADRGDCRTRRRRTAVRYRRRSGLCDRRFFHGRLFGPGVLDPQTLSACRA